MTPNFALSLSFDGIALLQRVPDGWHLVGDVPLDTSDLPAALETLRQKALTLSPSGLRTKLVIPADQIRFMTLDTAKTSQADVRAALDGNTPYALDELVIDVVRTTDQTHIAAVARETLQEAEAFATEHHFNPVAFVALPEDHSQQHEVFFGPTQAGVDVARDAQPAIQTGVVTMPAPLAAAQVSDTAPADAADAPPADAAPDGPVFASRSKVVPPTIGPVRRAGGAAPLAAAGMPGGTVPASVSPRGPAPTAPMAGVGMPGGTAPPAPPVAAVPVTPPASEPLFTRRKEPPAPAGPAKARAATPTPAAADSPPTPRAPDAAPVTAQRTTPPPPQTPAAAVTPRGKPRFLGLILTAVLLLILLLVGLWASTLTTDDIAGWFGGGTDVATVEDPAGPDTIGAVPDPVTAPVTAAQTDVVPAPAPAPSAIAPPETTAEAPPLPIVRAPVGRVLSPAEADRIYAATGVYQRAPRIATTPDSTPLEDIDPIVAVPAPDALPQPDKPAGDTDAPDAVIATQVAPPGPDVTFARDARGNILATPDGTVTPQGAIVFAGAPDLRPVLRPGTPRVATAPVAPVARPADLVPDTAAIAPAEADQTGTIPAAGAPGAFVAGPPPIRPVLRPTDAAAAATPEVVVVTVPAVDYTGVRPQLRPNGLVVTPDTPDAAAAVIAAYTGARPVLRPASLAPAPTEETLTPAPVAAPADITAIAAAIAAAAPASTFRNRTALAVSVAPRPAPRPRNFSQVVARARQATAPAPAAAAPTRTAAVAATPAPPTIVAPSGNVPGGVARAATVDNAMNLRKMNLVGVYGKPNARRALVRLGNGRYVKVEVGSALDGGQVTAIGDSALNFVKRGRTYALALPS